MAKPILAVIEELIVLQMAEKLFIDEPFKYLTCYRKQDDGAIVTWLRMLTLIRTTEATFQDEGNTESDKHRLYSLARIDDSSG